jgi:hypothetical protein
VGLFAAYRNLVGPTSEASDIYHFGALAVILSLLIGRTCGLPFGTRPLFPNVLAVITGRSALARKSSSIDDCVQLVLDPLKPGPVGGVPTLSVIDGSGSGEGFFDALADVEIEAPPNSGNVKRIEARRAVYVIHEFGGILAKMGRDQAGKMLDFMLQLFDAKPVWTHTTRSGGHRQATDAVGVMLAATTESWLLDTLTVEQIYAGLANRFLWLTGLPKAPMAFRTPISAAAHQALLAQAGRCLTAVASAGEFTFDPGARTLHEGRYGAFYWANQLPDGEAESESGASVTRSDILALKVAMLLATAQATATVDAATMATAWQVVDYSNAIVARYVELLRASGVEMAERRMRTAADSLLLRADAPAFTKSELRDRVKGKRGIPTETFNRVWKAWLEAGELAPIDVSRWKFRVAS